MGAQASALNRTTAAVEAGEQALGTGSQEGVGAQVVSAERERELAAAATVVRELNQWVLSCRLAVGLVITAAALRTTATTGGRTTTRPTTCTFALEPPNMP